MQTTYRVSYTNHYRAGLVRLLEVLQFRSEDSHQPVLEACSWSAGTRASPQLTYYPEGESVPVHGGLSGDWQDLAYRTDGRGHRRVVRTIYEMRSDKEGPAWADAGPAGEAPGPVRSSRS